MTSLRLGITGVLLAGGLTAAAAQEASAPPQPSADRCSFLGCLLGNRAEPVAAPGPQAVPSPAPVAAAAEDTTVTQAAAPRAAAKPAPMVTLAAEAAERPRLKALASARPRHRIHLVAPQTGDAELRLAPTLDPASGAASLHLYSEQMHVIAGPAIKTLADLRDKQVSFGPGDGATAAVARRAFAAAGVTVREVPLEDANALDGLATGDIDAVVVLAAEPSPVISALHASGLHLVGWPEATEAPAGARTQTLAAATYPRLAGGDTRVLAIDAVLTLTARGERSPAARGLFASLRQQTGSLARRGFDRLGADLQARRTRRVASDERR